jgi:serine/threonine protein kinase
VSTATLPTGTVFHGRYRIVRALKSGGMGTVYEVADENTASPRALKVMLPSTLADADQRARFALEARVTGSIESDHLVKISDSGIDEASASPFLVMELLRGEELGDMHKRRGALPPAEVITYLSQTSLALDKTHAAGIVHRDLKPDNLFVTKRDDGSPCVKILDFGIAKVVAENQATRTRALGTPLYMAPEQVRGLSGIGPRADLYSLAHVAYALLTGEAYLKEEAETDAGFFALMMKIVDGAAEPPEARALRRKGVRLAPGFDAWFLRATAVSPDARFDRASVQTGALAAVLSMNGVQAVASPRSSSDATGSGRISMTAPPTADPPSVAPWSAQVSPQAHSLPTGAPPVASAAPPTLQSAVSPKARSHALPIAIAVAGLAVAAGLVVVGVALLGGGPGGWSQAIAGCAPGMTCVALDIPDPAHVDAQAILPAIEKIARDADSHAGLTAIMAGAITRDGTSDISAGAQLSYEFISATAMTVISVRKKTATVMKVNPQVSPPILPDPHCSVKGAWKAAAAAGFLPAQGSFALYRSDGGSLVWSLYNGKQLMVDARTCAAKSR